MKTKKHLKQSISLSGKKTQVGSIDSSIAYFLFAVFIIYITQTIITLNQPFQNQVNNEILEKKNNILRTRIMEDAYTKESFQKICNHEMKELIGLRAEYEIIGIPIPGWDYNTLSSDLLFKRENNILIINISSKNNEESLELIIPSNTEFTINKNNTEPDDEYLINKTWNKNNLLTINTNTSINDYDLFRIRIDKPEKTIIFLNKQTIPKNKTSIGTTPIVDNCGINRGLLEKTYLTKYSLVNDFPARIGVDAWWQ